MPESSDLFAWGDVGALVLQICHKSLHRHQVLALRLIVHDVGNIFGGDTLATCGYISKGNIDIEGINVTSVLINLIFYYT